MLSEKIIDYLNKDISKSELIKILHIESDGNYNISFLGNYLLVFDLKSDLNNLLEIIRNDGGFKTDEEYEFFSRALNQHPHMASYYNIDDRAYSDSYEYVREQNYICDLHSTRIQEKIFEYARKLGIRECHDLILLIGNYINYDRISDEHASQRIDDYSSIVFSSVESTLDVFLRNRLKFNVLDKKEKKYYISLNKFLKMLKVFEKNSSKTYETFPEYIAKFYYTIESMDEDYVYEYIDECFWETSVTDNDAYEKVIIDVLEDAYIEAIEQRRNIKEFNEIINFIEKKLKIEIGSFIYHPLPKNPTIGFRVKSISEDNKIFINYKNVDDYLFRNAELSFDNFKLFLYHPELDLK